MEAPLIKYSTYCSFFHPCNNSAKLKLLQVKNKTKLFCEFPNCWGSSKIDLWKLWKLEKLPKKFIKEKAFKIAHPILNSNIFKTLQTSKQKWWVFYLVVVSLHLYFWQGLVEENKMPLIFENANNARNWKLKQVTSENFLQLSSRLYQGLIMINEGHIKVFIKFWIV